MTRLNHSMYKCPHSHSGDVPGENRQPNLPTLLERPSVLLSNFGGGDGKGSIISSLLFFLFWCVLCVHLVVDSSRLLPILILFLSFGFCLRGGKALPKTPPFWEHPGAAR